MEEQRFKIKGMTCVNCEKVIKETLLDIKGVSKATADYASGTLKVEFDKGSVSEEKIIKSLEHKGYDCSCEDLKEQENKKKNNAKNLIGYGFGILGIIIAGFFLYNLSHDITLPSISENMGYGLLFITGLLTGFHCIGMCGGFVLSYTAKDAREGKNSYGSHILYGAGKLVSYTVIGAAFGLLGSIVAFTPMIRGLAGIGAGIFLVMFGLNMLNLFPFLRRLRLRTPKFLDRFVAKKSKSRKPLVIGLLNGLMIACGPLQAIYIMAAGTGSVVQGGVMLFIFAAGTLPVMIGFGMFATMISRKLTSRILQTSGVIVIILGVIMINRGLALTGTGLDSRSIIASVSADENSITGNAVAIEDDYQIIEMAVTRNGWEPDKFVLRKDVPVKWKIDGKEINGCNNAIQVPAFGLEFNIRSGEQVIEFTPTKEGVIPWSCWMGMIPGTFIVKEGMDVSDDEAVAEELKQVDVQPSTGSCGGSCGSFSCGMDISAEPQSTSAPATISGCGCGR